MNKKRIRLKNSKGIRSFSTSVKNNVVRNNEEFEIPFEAACSPEFAEGCILREDNED